MSDAKDKTDAAASKKKSKLVPVLLTVIFVLVAGGGGAGAYWYFNRPSPTAQATAAEPGAVAAPAPAPVAAPAPAPGMVDLEPFVVNLADPGGQRYVRVSMKLLTYNEEQAAELKENAVSKARLRSALLDLLSTQTADTLVTPEGKTALKKAIAERATHASHELKVTDVLFVEFIVQ